MSDNTTTIERLEDHATDILDLINTVKSMRSDIRLYRFALARICLGHGGKIEVTGDNHDEAKDIAEFRSKKHLLFGGGVVELSGVDGL